MVSIAAIVIGYDIIWLQFYRFVKVFDGIVMLAFFPVSYTAIVICFGIILVEVNCM